MNFAGGTNFTCDASVEDGEVVCDNVRVMAEVQIKWVPLSWIVSNYLNVIGGAFNHVCREYDPSLLMCIVESEKPLGKVRSHSPAFIFRWLAELRF